LIILGDRQCQPIIEGPGGFNGRTGLEAKIPAHVGDLGDEARSLPNRQMGADMVTEVGKLRDGRLDDIGALAVRRAEPHAFGANGDDHIGDGVDSRAGAGGDQAMPAKIDAAVATINGLNPSGQRIVLAD